MKPNLNIEFDINDFGGCQLLRLEKYSDTESHLFIIVGPIKKVLGLSRVNFFHMGSDLYAEIFVSLTPEFQKNGIFQSITEQLTSLAFENVECKYVLISQPGKEEVCSSVLERKSHDEMNSNSIVTRESYGLFSLSNIIKKEKHNLIPNDNDLTRSLIERVAPIWYKYFSKGVDLSRGGVEHSFITLEQLFQNPSLQTFNLYRSDIGSVNISEDLIKNFLVEEGALSKTTNILDLRIIFSLGAHEGILRVARCIYNEHLNNGIFFAQGGYGLLAAAFYGMAPIGYKIHLADVDRENGEKYLLPNLETLFQEYPNAKTIFLELKTVAGAVYTSSELIKIITLCKKYKVFLLIDAVHANLHYDEVAAFADVVHLFQTLDYHEYAVVYTGSKTYGLERGRVGFIVLSKFIESSTPDIILVDFYRNIGAGFDLPFEIASALLNAPLELRKKYLAESREYLRFNMNLMLAYVEGRASRNIDKDLLQSSQFTIPSEFERGINGVKVIFKPQAGIQMKIDMSRLSHLYFYNVQMFNSEIFSYALNKVAGVVTLHSNCFLFSDSFGLRLSYSYRDDVHNGMKKISTFVSMLTSSPQMNRYMPDTLNVKFYLEESLKSHNKRNKDYSSEKQSNTFFKHKQVLANPNVTASNDLLIGELPKAKL